jgi:amidophosphoribosyltransferase
VDTPTREELIASSNSPEQIRKFLGADSLGYISMAGLRQAVDDKEGKFCTSCYTGVYPTDLVQLEVRAGKAGAGNGVVGDLNGNSADELAIERPVVVESEG